MGWVTHEYRVSFVTPAFLGNAEQQAQWRTPPFKALLRQWWRVANGAACKYDVAELARREGELFGVASDDRSGSRRSQVQLRLSAWSEGKINVWDQDPTVQHPEVTRPDGTPRSIGAHLYLGYGPLSFTNGKTSLNTMEAAEWQSNLDKARPSTFVSRKASSNTRYS